jgi:hypothetical protein
MDVTFCGVECWRAAAVEVLLKAFWENAVLFWLKEQFEFYQQMF